MSDFTNEGTDLRAEVTEAVKAVRHYLKELETYKGFGSVWSARRLTEQSARLECAIALLSNRPTRQSANDLLSDFQNNAVYATE